MVEHEKTGPLDSITWGLSRITMWLPAFIVAIIFFEVTMRYVFGRATMWVNETSLWVAGAVYLFAGLYSMQQRSHIRIYILYDLAPRWLRKTFDVISTICIVIFAVALIWGSYDEAVRKFLFKKNQEIKSRQNVFCFLNFFYEEKSFENLDQKRSFQKKIRSKKITYIAFLMIPLF